MSETFIYIKNNYVKYWLFSLILFGILLIINLSYGFGFILGNIIFFLVMNIKVKYIDDLLKMKFFSKKRFIFIQLIIYLLMLSGFMFSLKISLINPYAYFLGFIGFKMYLLLKGGR